MDIARGPQGAVAVDKFRREHGAFGDLDAVFVLLFIDQGKGVSRADVQREVDVPGIDCRQLHDQIIG